MGIKNHIKAILFILTLFFYCNVQGQNNYKSHTVKKGETVFSIAKQYKVTEAALYNLNPDARKGIQENNILIIPLSDTNTVLNQEVIDFEQHRVRRKETLFSISKKYGVTIEDIKKYNKRLYSEALKKGDRIMIPIGLKTTVVSNDQNGGSADTSQTTVNDSTKTHTVLPKETKYGIARKYGITILELETLNPQINDTLAIGDQIRVPEKEVVDNTVLLEPGFEFYEVQPKEGFFRLKVKFGVTQDQVINWNPYAADGLKEGMILKLPIAKDTATENASNIVDLSYLITDPSAKDLVVMLPFNLSKVNRDSIGAKEELLQNTRTLGIALDFYSGVLMAADFAKDKGISVNIKTLDTEGSDAKVRQLVRDNNFEDVDAVIGPLFQKNAAQASSSLNSLDTPVFSPLSNQSGNGGSNFFQTIPSEGFLEDRMIEYLKAEALDRNIIVITDAKHAAQKNKLLATFPNAKHLSPREEGFLYVVDIQEQLDPIRENWFILEASNPVLVSNVIGLLNGLPPQNIVRLFTLDKSEAYDFEDIQNVTLANLKFTYPSVNKSYNYKEPNAFVTSYKNKYGVLPNRFAVRGFDVTLDIIYRLAMAESLYDALEVDGETEYIENKFFYVRNGRGYGNNAGYIMMYGEDLNLIVLE